MLLVGVSLFYRREGAAALQSQTPAEAVLVYVLDNGFHTDLVLPRRLIEAQGGPLAMAVAQMPPSDWVHVGWGDAEFFIDQTAIKSRWRDGLRALFGRNNSSVLRLYAGYGEVPRFAPDRLQAVHLSPRGMAQAIRRIDASLVLDGQGRPSLRHYMAADPTWFFDSGERFWLGHLCNHWTLDVLNAGGVTVWPWRPMTAGEVKRQAARAKAEAAARLDLRLQAH